MDNNYNSFQDYKVTRDIFGNTIVKNDIGITVGETSHRIMEGDYKGHELKDIEFELNRYSSKDNNQSYESNEEYTYSSSDDSDYYYDNNNEGFGWPLTIACIGISIALVAIAYSYFFEIDEMLDWIFIGVIFYIFKIPLLLITTSLFDKLRKIK
jgi:hypothetical protein